MNLSNYQLTIIFNRPNRDEMDAMMLSLISIYTIQPAVKPVVQPVSQPIILCKGVLVVTVLGDCRSFNDRVYALLHSST